MEMSKLINFGHTCLIIIYYIQEVQVFAHSKCTYLRRLYQMFYAPCHAKPHVFWSYSFKVRGLPVTKETSANNPTISWFVLLIH